MTGDVLIVDGYNMIGAWSELRELAVCDLESARDRLIETLADYQGYTGTKVIVVFDAHQVPGLGVKLQQSRIEILYTKEKETADECIERLVAQRISKRRRVIVATSDYAEQRVIFGHGALRLSARELRLQIEEMRAGIRQNIAERDASARNTFDSRIDESMRQLLEKWRRGK